MLELLEDKEYFVNESYEAVKMFDNAEKVLKTGDENPFSVYKKRLFNRTLYLIYNGLEDSHIILRDDKEELEKKLIDAEAELFTKIEELLGLKGKYQILDGALGVILCYPDLDAVDELFDAEEHKDYVDFHGDEIQIKYAKNDNFAYVEIPYQEFFKVYQHVLESEYKKVDF